MTVISECGRRTAFTRVRGQAGGASQQLTNVMALHIHVFGAFSAPMSAPQKCEELALCFPICLRRLSS